MYGTRPSLKHHVRFWECSPWSQNPSRTVYPSFLVLRQRQVFCVPEAPRVLESFFGFCLYRVLLVCSAGSVSLSQCSLHIAADGESLSELSLGRTAVTTLQVHLQPRPAVGVGPGCAMVPQAVPALILLNTTCGHLLFL